MSYLIQASPLCAAVHISPCGVFQAHWLPYGQTKYFAPVLIDTRDGSLFQAVIPHDRICVVFLPVQARAPRTSPFVSLIQDIERGDYNGQQLVAEFAHWMGGAA